LKSITRIDQPEKHTHGWYVRVRYSGEEISRFFSDKAQGGKKKSLDAAVKFRDSTERRLGKPRTDRFVVARSPRGSKHIPGVRQVMKSTRLANGELKASPVYEVTWSPEPNVLKRTSISIKKFGRADALKRAVALRKKKEKQFYTGKR
jgi:hypothetical protein